MACRRRPVSAGSLSVTAPVEHGQRAHAALGASNSEIWLNCTGSVALSRGRERKATVHTRAGTAAHQFGEDAIRHGTLPEAGDIVEVEGEPVEVTDEMIDAVLLYSTFVNEIGDRAEWVLIEGRFSLGDLWETGVAPEPLFGTADYTAVVLPTLEVADLKFGKGKIVNPEANTQLLYYGVGAYLRLKREKPELARQIKDVTLTIVQPRAGKEKIKSWGLPLVDLLAWAYGDLKPTVEAIARNETSLHAGNHCFFCVAAPVCPKLHEAKVQRAVEAFPDYNTEN